MLKYMEAAVVLQEVPDEVSLAISISGCPHRCPGCHSAWLQEDAGMPLLNNLDKLIDRYPGISCVCLMGGDQSHDEIGLLCDLIHIRGLKTCFYSGNDTPPSAKLQEKLDYLKIGPYIQSRGPLSDPNTNQKFWKKTSDGWEDITYRFLPPKHLI